MKNTFALLLFLLAGIGSTISAQNMYEEAIKESLHNYQLAILVKDYKTAASHLHPEITEKGGGSELFADILKADLESYLCLGNLHATDLYV